jgi:hypothetical protein
MKKLICSIIMLGAAIVVPCHLEAKPTPPVTTTAVLTFNDGVNPQVVVLDNSLLDASSIVGALTITKNVGVWQVIISGVTKPVSGSATSPLMDISVQAISSGPGMLMVTLSDKNFGGTKGTATGVVNGEETGNMIYGAGTVDFAVWGDGGNTIDALTTLLADAGPEVWPPALTFFPGSLALNQPFSLTEVLNIQVSTASYVTVDASLQVTLDMGSVGHCRVTGGSNHETNNSQSACVTTPPPTFVSHGGQVGAALSDETQFMPYDPCISGEWEHNRHLTANSLVGVLHASGNGNIHEFDSLLCACLPCPGDPGAVGVVGTLCNPKDKVCGPQPSPAPANKICFSGVGDFTFSTGPRTVKAVFRVDIEDHGEGNSAANPLPRDRYRIRIWLLDPNCGRDPNPDSSTNMALRFGASADPAQISNNATTENLKDPTIGPPDIDDGGTMTQGNHQIHFATGAACQ